MFPYSWHLLSRNMVCACIVSTRIANRFVCARQLKWVRKQFNEYETMKRTLLYMTITLASYVIVVLFLLGDKPVLQRRISIFCERLYCCFAVSSCCCGWWSVAILCIRATRLGKNHPRTPFEEHHKQVLQLNRVASLTSGRSIRIRFFALLHTLADHQPRHPVAASSCDGCLSTAQPIKHARGIARFADLCSAVPCDSVCCVIRRLDIQNVSGPWRPVTPLPFSTSPLFPERRETQNKSE